MSARVPSSLSQRATDGSRRSHTTHRTHRRLRVGGHSPQITMSNVESGECDIEANGTINKTSPAGRPSASVERRPRSSRLSSRPDRTGRDKPVFRGRDFPLRTTTRHRPGHAGQLPGPTGRDAASGVPHTDTPTRP